jgi:hypothetical protein
MLQHSDRIRDFIRFHASELFPSLTGMVEVDIDRACRLPQGPYRYRIVSGTDTRYLWAKKGRAYRSLGPEAEIYNIDTFTEFNHLKNLIAIACERFGSPRPLAYLDAGYILLTEDVPGQSLLERVIAECRPWRSNSLSKMETIIESCASWLRAFHETCHAEELPHGPSFQRSTELILSAVAQSWQNLALGGQSALSETLRSRISELAPRLASFLDSVSHPRTAVHGDFAFGNILVQDEKVIVLDMFSNQLSNPEGDVASLACQLEMMPYHRLVNPMRTRRLMKRFMSAYYQGNEPDAESRSLLRIFRLRCLIVSLDRHCRAASNLPSPFRQVAGLTIRFVYGLKISRLGTELEQLVSQEGGPCEPRTVDSL